MISITSTKIAYQFDQTKKNVATIETLKNEIKELDSIAQMVAQENPHLDHIIDVIGKFKSDMAEILNTPEPGTERIKRRLNAPEIENDQQRIQRRITEGV